MLVQDRMLADQLLNATYIKNRRQQKNEKISAASCFNLDIRNQCRWLQGDEESHLINRISYEILQAGTIYDVS